MPKETVKDLLRFLKPFPEQVRKNVLWLRDFVWELYPDSNELIYDNYNAVAFGWSISDKVSDLFCTIAVGRTSHNVQFGFYWGAKIADPEKRLIGEGNQYRYLLVPDTTKFPKTYIKKLLKNAHAYCLAKKKEGKPLHGATIVKSISAKKRGVK